jgi:hypothetical protein
MVERFVLDSLTDYFRFDGRWLRDLFLDSLTDYFRFDGRWLRDLFWIR